MVVHALHQAEAALAAAGPQGVLLLSAAGAGRFAGPAWFLAMTAEAAGRRPGVISAAALDCGDAPGAALTALRAGARIIVLDGRCPSFAAVAAAAGESGATLLPRRPDALDLGRLDLRRRDDRARIAAWCAMKAPQAPARPPAP